MIKQFLKLGVLALTLVNASSLSADDQLIISNVNKQRKAKGVPEACLSSQISQAAQVQSQYQAQMNNMTHSGTQPVNDRIKNAGFALDSSQASGECVGVSFGSDNLQMVFDAWVADPPHYNIIINGTFTHFGWSKVPTSDGKNWYYTLDFAKASGNSQPCQNQGQGQQPEQQGQSLQQPPSTQSSTNTQSPNPTQETKHDKYEGKQSSAGAKPTGQALPSNQQQHNFSNPPPSPPEGSLAEKLVNIASQLGQIEAYLNNLVQASLAAASMGNSGQQPQLSQSSASSKGTQNQGQQPPPYQNALSNPDEFYF